MIVSKVTLQHLIWLVMAVAAAAPASAMHVCEARVVQRVAAREDSSATMNPGERFGALTQFVVERKSGRTFLCQHGGYCYPTRVVKRGESVSALQLVNCTVNRIAALSDADETIHYLDVLRSKVPAVELKVYDVATALEDLGVPTVGSVPAATLYVRRPSSRCAGLVRRALSKDARAISTLTDATVPYCQSGG